MELCGNGDCGVLWKYMDFGEGTDIVDQEKEGVRCFLQREQWVEVSCLCPWTIEAMEKGHALAHAF